MCVQVQIASYSVRNSLDKHARTGSSYHSADLLYLLGQEKMVAEGLTAAQRLCPVAKRVMGQKYTYKDGIQGTWDGRQLRCEHNRRRDSCKDCGGSQICFHNRQRVQCKDCGGASICIHMRQRSACKECGGSQICKHNRRRAQCVSCGGASICEHDMVRYRCKECGGSGICEHKKQRAQCIECHGSSICIHKRRRENCKQGCKTSTHTTPTDYMHALNGLTGLRCVEVVEADALATLLGFVNSKVDEAELKAADIEAAAPVTPANAATNADWPMPPFRCCGCFP